MQRLEHSLFFSWWVLQNWYSQPESNCIQHSFARPDQTLPTRHNETGTRAVPSSSCASCKAWRCLVLSCQDEFCTLHGIFSTLCASRTCVVYNLNTCAAGIGYSDDKMLQTRIFSYADTQRYRLGPNYLMLPVNAPKNVHHNNHHDGVMNFMHRDEEVSHAGIGFTDICWLTCAWHSAVIAACQKGLARPACCIRSSWADRQSDVCHLGL